LTDSKSYFIIVNNLINEKTMKRKINEVLFKRAGGWCKPVKIHYFRLGVVGDESNGKKPLYLNEGCAILGN